MCAVSRSSRTTEPLINAAGNNNNTTTFSSAPSERATNLAQKTFSQTPSSPPPSLTSRIFQQIEKIEWKTVAKIGICIACPIIGMIVGVLEFLEYTDRPLVFINKNDQSASLKEILFPNGTTTTQHSLQDFIEKHKDGSFTQKGNNYYYITTDRIEHKIVLKTKDNKNPTWDQVDREFNIVEDYDNKNRMNLVKPQSTFSTRTNPEKKFNNTRSLNFQERRDC